MHRPTWADIDLDALSDNYAALVDLSEGKTVIPVVKADAYGHGAKEVVRHLYERHNVRLFAVSLIEEALEIKAMGFDVDLLIMGAIKPSDLPVLSRHNLLFTLTNQNVFDAMTASSLPLRFHVKVDSGMHRLGFSDSDTINRVFKTAQKNAQLKLEGIFTHFATADSDEAYFYRQKARFEEILNELPYMPMSIHASNSSAVVKYQKSLPYTTHVRTGISLYGYSLEGRLHFLKPVMTLKSEVMEIRTLEPGDYLGYDIAYQASEREKIAILPIGYADGWIRKNQGGVVRIHGKPYPIVGRVCMDMMFVKIDESVHRYDEVTLFGQKEIDANSVADRLDTISYEVLCMVGKRVPRNYKTLRT